jgi:hypothetical protein
MAGEANPEVKTSLSRTCGNVPGLAFSILQLEGETLLRLSARGEDEQDTELILMQGRELLRERLGTVVYGLGMVTLEKTVADCLTHFNRKLTVVDGVSGGLLPHLLARQEKSSEFLREAKVICNSESGLSDAEIAALTDDGSLALCLLPGKEGGARLVVADSGRITHNPQIPLTDSGNRPLFESYLALDLLRTHLGWEGGA